MVISRDIGPSLSYLVRRLTDLVFGAKSAPVLAPSQDVASPLYSGRRLEEGSVLSDSREALQNGLHSPFLLLQLRASTTAKATPFKQSVFLSMTFHLGGGSDVIYQPH